ncbi:hypothetical protein MXB_4510, partial [Myxobolus squamalis]
MMFTVLKNNQEDAYWKKNYIISVKINKKFMLNAAYECMESINIFAGCESRQCTNCSLELKFSAIKFCPKVNEKLYFCIFYWYKPLGYECAFDENGTYYTRLRKGLEQ